jgi:Fic family protein
MTNTLPVNPKPRLDSLTISLASEIDRTLAHIDGICGGFPFEKTVFDLLSKSEAIESFCIDNYFEKISSVPEFFALQESLNKNLENYFSASDLGNKLLKNISRASHIINSIYLELSEKKSNEPFSENYFRKNSANFDEKTKLASNQKYYLPDPAEIPLLMQNLDDYIALDVSYPVVINAAIIHGQLELIHPFDSMNGLAGRLLFLLHLKWKNRLSLPVLQLSKSLRNKKLEYFDRLEDLARNNNWDAWIKFFLRTANDAALNTKKRLSEIFMLRHNDMLEFHRKELISTSFMTIYNYLYKNPVVTVPKLTSALKYSKQTVNILISKLIEEKILTETTGQQRYRVYEFKKLLDILD